MHVDHSSGILKDKAKRTVLLNMQGLLQLKSDVSKKKD